MNRVIGIGYKVFSNAIRVPTTPQCFTIRKGLDSQKKNGQVVAHHDVLTDVVNGKVAKPGQPLYSSDRVVVLPLMSGG